MSYAKKQEKEEGQRARVPMGGRRSNLQLSDQERLEFEKRGMVPRWVNDRDGRIERARAGGWTFVDPEHAKTVGSYEIGKGNTDIGDKVSKVVSRGDSVVRAFLMEISKEFYAEDQDAKEKVNRRVDDALSGGEAGGSGVENKYGPGVTYSK